VSHIFASQIRKVVEVPIHVWIKWIVVFISTGTADMLVRNWGPINWNCGFENKCKDICWPTYLYGLSSLVKGLVSKWHTRNYTWHNIRALLFIATEQSRMDHKFVCIFRSSFYISHEWWIYIEIIVAVQGYVVSWSHRDKFFVICSICHNIIGWGKWWSITGTKKIDEISNLS
jgi:hypothetical protein